MPLSIETKLENIEKELKEIRRKVNLSNSRKKFFKSAGSWSKIDTEKLKKNIHESRKVVSKEKVEF